MSLIYRKVARYIEVYSIIYLYIYRINSALCFA